MRILTEGFETRVGTAFWSASSITTSTGYSRISGVGARTGSSSLTAKLDELDEFYTRFAYGNYGSTGSGITNVSRFRIRNAAGSTVLILAWGYPPYSNTIKLYLNNLPALVLETDPIIQTGYCLFEMYYRYTDQPGTTLDPNFEIRRDGLSVLKYTGATMPVPPVSPPPAPESLVLGYIDFSIFDSVLDDIAINDTNGASDNSWCGDGHIIALQPSADGSSSQFVGSDGNSLQNWQLVDEIPANATDYVESNVPGDVDFYTLSNPNPALKTHDVIRRVWVSATVRELSADGDQISLGVKVDPQTQISWGTPLTLETTFREKRTEDFISKPAGGSWENADLDNLQVGVQNE